MGSNYSQLKVMETVETKKDIDKEKQQARQLFIDWVYNILEDGEAAAAAIEDGDWDETAANVNKIIGACNSMLTILKY